MKSLSLILIAYLSTNCIAICQDLSGAWSGTLTQGGRITFTTELTMQQLGTMLSGTYKCILGDRIWVIEKISGHISGDVIVLTETEVVGRGPADEGYCLKILKGVLTTDRENKQYIYQGKWTSKKLYGAGKYIDYECTPGEFKMSKLLPPKQEKKPSIVKSMISGQASSPTQIESIPLPPSIVVNGQALKKGESITLNSIQFEQTKSDLLHEGKADLNKVIQLMKEYPALIIELSGHTSNEEKNESMNVRLSKQRVAACKNYIANQVDNANSRIKTVGYGSSKPRVSNNSDENRKKNRRVELKVESL